MSRFVNACFLILFLIFAFTANAWAGHDSRQKLIMLADKYSEKFYREKAEAIKLAQELDLVVRKEFEDGRVIELMRFVDGMPVYYTTHNLEGSGLINTNEVWPGGKAGLSLTGEGQTLGIWDGGKTRLTHQEFEERAEQKDDAVDLSHHATHVAGTMIAGGIEEDAKGMSYQAHLDAYDWNDDAAEMAAAAADGLLVSNHSYGFITGWEWGFPYPFDWGWLGDVTVSETEDYLFGFYTEEARVWDEIVYEAPGYFIVKAAGNDRNDFHDGGHYYWKPGVGWTWSTAYREPDGGEDGYNSIAQVGNAKNILTVGAVDIDEEMSAFSSWGPTDDGRVKPDIVAKGVGVYSATAQSDSSYDTWAGTSMASPMVSGSTGLLIQHHEDLHGPDDPLLASTMKGLIIHGADDSISGAPGPDYRFGWGLMDTQRSVEIMSLDKEAGKGAHIRELILSQNNVLNLPVMAEGSEPLRATIVWTDVPGEPPQPSLNPTDLMLVNDLDLRIIDEQENVAMPYVLDPNEPSEPAFTGDNIRDNVEMVHIDEPNPGQTYQVQISHKGNLVNNNSQNFSLIVTGGELMDRVIELAKTGQTVSFGPRDDGELQKGAAWPEPRFTDNEDGSVTDNLTGLVWLKDAACFGEKNWEDALDSANDLASGECGLSDGSSAGDWYLPNRRQLESLVDISQYNPSLPDGHPFIGTEDELHCWSSSTYAETTDSAWTVDISYGNSVCPKTDILCVWPVRSGLHGLISLPATGQQISYGPRDDGELQKGTVWPEPRFQDNQDGTVKDRLTGLVWLKELDCLGLRTWEEALSDANELEEGVCGLSDGSSAGDWYLPNRRQLESLVDISQYDPSLPEGHPFTDVHELHAWSGSTFAEDPVFAWTVSFSSIDYFPNGFVVLYPKTPFSFPIQKNLAMDTLSTAFWNQKLSVWPVRKSPAAEAPRTLPGVLMLLLDDDEEE